MAGGFHPSFGQPDDVIEFRPKRLGARCADNDAPALQIRVPPAEVFGLFAHRQWRAGMLMADALFTGAFDVRDRAVVELGAGTALPSLTAAICGGARCVAATDYDNDTLLAALRHNTRRNLESNGAHAPFVAMGQTWGHSCEDVLDWLPRSSARYDAVLLADCMWDQFSHDDLLKTVSSLLARTSEARVYVVSGFHTGRGKVVHFLRRAARVGLRLVPLGHEELWPPLTGNPEPVEDAESPLHRSSELVLELEMGGELDESVSTQVDGASYLTGVRRPFAPERTVPDTTGKPIEEPVQERNRWLSVFAMGWSNL